MKNTAFKIFYFLRLHNLFKHLFQKDKVTILLFHELPLVNAEKIITFLNKSYSVITLDDYINYRINHSPKLPNFPLVITFDDGRRSNLELMGLFQKFKNRPTIYVCSNKDRLDGFDLFNNGELKRARGVFDIQAHTISHPNLKEVTEKTAITEIGKCKKDLENKLGDAITSFAYPYGKYNDRDVRIVRAEGYTNAVTVDFGFNDLQTNIFRLNRICISDTPTLYETAIKACGFWGFLKKRIDALSV
ncbi:polysaccharide deacetylase family protein [Muricauda sp. NFXS6]|uniref:polysaccharide deacetylase family protein n=1 Tax=Allomuricauda sp. NFXS6 TaxID=2819094 RepID=UPI0032DE6A9E